MDLGIRKNTKAGIPVMPKVSIIVPVYNVEHYVDQCFTSLLAQTLKDIEIIAVDDGSPDSSADIIQSYADKDPRLKLIRCENGGVSRARNIGIAAATGDYIGFVDADDWVEEDMYEGLYHACMQNDLDVCICGFFWEYPNKKPIPEQIRLPAGIRLPRSFVEKELVLGTLYGMTFASIWKLLTRRKLLIDNNIRFPEKLDSMEDNLFGMHVYFHARSIMYIDQSYYHYRKLMAGNLSKKFRPDYVKLVENLLAEINSFLETHFRNDSQVRDSFDLGVCFIAINEMMNACHRDNAAPRKQKLAVIEKVLGGGSVRSAIDRLVCNECYMRSYMSSTPALRAVYTLLKSLLSNHRIRILFLVFSAMGRFENMMFYFESIRGMLSGSRSRNDKKLTVLHAPSE